MDSTNYPLNELVGVFDLEELADKACIGKNHCMFVLEFNKAEQDSIKPEDYPFGYKYPRLDEQDIDYENKGSYRLPDDYSDN